MKKAFDINKYLVDDGKGGKNIVYNDLASPFFSAKALELYASRANFSAGGVVEGYAEKGQFTDEVYARINALKDFDLAKKLSHVKYISEIFRSIVISFNADKRFVITIHFTELGAEFVSAIKGKKYEVDTEHYEFGTFDINLESSDGQYYDCGVELKKFNGVKFCLNAENGLVVIKNLLFKDIPTVIVNEAANATGGYDIPPAEIEKIFAGSVLKDVRYGDRVMRKVVSSDLNYEKYKDESEEQRTMRQTLSVYVPSNFDKTRENGVILCIHGGSWVEGDKSSYDAQCKYYAHLGYFAVTVNHTYCGRVYEDNGEVATFLSIENELDLAMKKIKEMSDENGWNITKAATTGYSSGSHLAMLYAYGLGNRKGAPIPVVCTFSMVGPMSFYMNCWQERNMPIGPQIAGMGLNDLKLFEVPEGREDLARLLKDVTDGKQPKSAINGYEFTPYTVKEYSEKLNRVSPLAYVKKGEAVPTVLAEAGLDNMLISIQHGLDMEKALTEAEVDHKVIVFANSDHAGAGNAECGNVYRKYQKLYLKKYFGY